MLIRTDGGGGTRDFLKWLAGQGLSYSFGFTLTHDMADKGQLADLELRHRRRARCGDWSVSLPLDVHG